MVNDLRKMSKQQQQKKRTRTRQLRKPTRWIQEQKADLYTYPLGNKELPSDEDLAEVAPKESEALSDSNSQEWWEHTLSLPSWMLSRLAIVSEVSPDAFLEESELASGRWSPVSVSEMVFE